MRFKPKKLVEYLAMLVIWLALVALFGLLSHNFLSERTFVTSPNRIPALSVVATGMTLVLIIGGIDLSVGSVLGLCGAVVGLALVNFHLPLWAAILPRSLRRSRLRHGEWRCQRASRHSFVRRNARNVGNRTRAGLHHYQLADQIHRQRRGRPFHTDCRLAVSPAFIIAVLVIVTDRWCSRARYLAAI